jgi:hypothetical protein
MKKEKKSQAEEVDQSGQSEDEAMAAIEAAEAEQARRQANGPDAGETQAVPHGPDQFARPGGGPQGPRIADGAAAAGNRPISIFAVDEAKAYAQHALAQLSSTTAQLTPEARYAVVRELLMKLADEFIEADTFVDLLWKIQAAAPQECVQVGNWLLECGRFYAAPVIDPSGKVLERYAIIVRAALSRQLGIENGAQGMLLDMAVESYRQWIFWSHRTTAAVDCMDLDPKGEARCRDQADEHRRVFLKIMDQLGIEGPRTGTRKPRPRAA